MKYDEEGTRLIFVARKRNNMAMFLNLRGRKCLCPHFEEGKDG